MILKFVLSITMDAVLYDSGLVKRIGAFLGDRAFSRFNQAGLDTQRATGIEQDERALLFLQQVAQEVHEAEETRREAEYAVLLLNIIRATRGMGPLRVGMNPGELSTDDEEEDDDEGDDSDNDEGDDDSDNDEEDDAEGDDNAEGGITDSWAVMYSTMM